jgi:hypothetical protein
VLINNLDLFFVLLECEPAKAPQKKKDAKVVNKLKEQVEEWIVPGIQEYFSISSFTPFCFEIPSVSTS